MNRLTRALNRCVPEYLESRHLIVDEYWWRVEEGCGLWFFESRSNPALKIFSANPLRFRHQHDASDPIFVLLPINIGQTNNNNVFAASKFQIQSSSCYSNKTSLLILLEAAEEATLLRRSETIFFTPAPVPKRETSSGAHWKFTLRLLLTLWKLETSVYFVSWRKSIVEATVFCLNPIWTTCHGFSAGKQLVASCLHCMKCRLNSNCKA